MVMMKLLKMDIFVVIGFLLVGIDLSRADNAVPNCVALRAQDDTCRNDPSAVPSSCPEECGPGVANHHYLCGPAGAEVPIDCSENCCKKPCDDDCMMERALEEALERETEASGGGIPQRRSLSPETRSLTPTFWFGTPCYPHDGPGKMWVVYLHVDPNDGICFYQRDCCCHPEDDHTGGGSGVPPATGDGTPGPGPCRTIQEAMAPFLWCWACPFHPVPAWLGDNFP